MGALPILWIVWGGVAIVLLILLGYRGTLTRYEEDQIFLDDSGKHHETEQHDIVVKIQKIQPYVRVAIGAASLMTVCILGLYVWDAMSRLK
jgi:hypothetical protein